MPYDGEHPYVIVLGVKSEESLKNAIDKVRGAGILGVEFREPDRNNELTAFATVPQYGERPDIFRKFQLLK